MKPKRIFPSKEKLIANREFYKYKRLTYRGTKMVFDQDIKTGVCHFCKRSVKKREISWTGLQHLLYDNHDPLTWTVEVCSSCHYKVDEKNKTKIDMYYENKENIKKL